MTEYVPSLIGAATAVLLLYVGLVMRQFARSVERLESVTESLRDSLVTIVQRLATLEAQIGSKD